MTEPKGPSYDYRANAIGVVDGDTIDLKVDLGFTVFVDARVRLLGVNCPELHGSTAKAGKDAQTFTASWLWTHSTEITMRSYKAKEREKYGRWLAEIFPVGGGISLNQALLDSGNAVPMSLDGT
jgi:micrococcal nuclease